MSRKHFFARRARGLRSRSGRFLALAAFLAIAALTLAPMPGQSAVAEATPLWCVVCGDYGGVDVLNNVLLFVPLGAGLWLCGIPTRSVIGLGALVSLTVELLQLLVIPGRDASLSDLLTNTLGTWIGAALTARRPVLLRPTMGQATRLAFGAGLVWIGVQSLSGVLLRPWTPQSTLHGAWGRAIPGRDRFDGRITSASVSNVVIPRHGATLGQELAARLRQGQVRVELELVTGRKGGSWAPVLEVRSHARTVLGLEALGRDLVFEAPARSQLLRLRRPILRLKGALPSGPGTLVAVAAGLRADTLWGVWNSGGQVEKSVQVLGPSLGWSLVTPIRYTYGGGVRIITAVWLALWMVPLGYWSGRAANGWLHAVWLPGIVLLAGLGLVPGLLGYPASHWSEWLAGLGGLSLGWAAWQCAAYLGLQRCDSRSTSESY